VGMLSRIRKSTPKEIMLKIYTSSIQPTIDYALTVWGNTSLQNLNSVQRIQNYAARIITGQFDYINVRGIDLVKKLGWMSISQRYQYFCLLLMFKCVHGLAPHYLCNNVIMKCEINARETRSMYSHDIHVPFVTSEAAMKTLMYTGAKLWNAMPSHIKQISEIDAFKVLLRNHVFTVS